MRSSVAFAPHRVDGGLGRAQAVWNRRDCARHEQRRAGVEAPPRRAPAPCARPGRRGRCRRSRPRRRPPAARPRPWARRSRRGGYRRCGRRRRGTRRSWCSPVVDSSSRPSAPCTTQARSEPSSRSAFATSSVSSGFGTPTIWRAAPAGLVSGPSRLNALRMPRSRRVCARASSTDGTSARRRTPRPRPAASARRRPAPPPRGRPTPRTRRRCRIGSTPIGCRAWPRARPWPPRPEPPRTRC